MKRSCTLAASALLVLISGCTRADGQGAAGTPADTTAVPDARQVQIAENLTFELPQLEGTDFAVGPIEPSEERGLDRGTFTVQGQTYHFLVTPDDERLYVLAREPFEANRSPEEIAAARAEAAELLALATRERAARLNEAIRGMPLRGNPDAPVTLVEFADFQCPYCARGADSLEVVLARYPNDVRFAYLHYPLPNHPWARPAAIAATCAAEQDDDAFWRLHDRYFEEQREVTPENVLARGRGYLAGSRINVARWEACATDTSSTAYRAAASRVAEMEALGRSYGVTGTPGFFVNGVLVSGAQPVARFAELIAEAKREAAGPAPRGRRASSRPQPQP